MRRYKKIHKSHNFLKFFIRIFWVFIISTISIALYDMYLNIDVENTQIIGDKTIAVAENSEVGKDISVTLEEISRTVVGISKIQSVDASFFSLKAIETYNLGTGVIIAKEGYVLTNYHVSGNKLTRCYVTLEDGKEYTAKVVWTDENLDLSILKIETTREVDCAELGDDDSLKIGQEVYAIGNPLGAEFQKTVTHGIISGLDRTIKIEDENNSSYMEELIQTDASINAGNSGGPLINSEGKVIGINSIKIKDAEGIGFAIPIDIIKPIIKRLVETGEYEEASLGIYVYDKEAIQYIDSSLDFEYGVYVTKVISEENGKSGDIKTKDIIEEIDGVKLNKINDLRKYIYTKNIGDEVTLKVLRNKKEIEVKTRLVKK